MNRHAPGLTSSRNAPSSRKANLPHGHATHTPQSSVPKAYSPSKLKSKGRFSGYHEAVRWLMSVTDYETMKRAGYNSTNFNLSRMHRLLAALKNPQKDLQFVHVAGTKGKGSVCTMTARMLEACGYKVGLYISPHIMDLRERITINGELIHPDELAGYLGRIEHAFSELGGENKDAPTFFEIMTAAALLHFQAHEVNVAVLEVGLGGRLDATNVVKPEVCAITGISLDHMEQLGRTVDKIAEEKAGIIKAGVPVVLYPNGRELDRQFRRIAEGIGAPVMVVGREIDYTSRFENGRNTGPHIRICVSTPNCRFDHVRVPLPGEHQAYNLAMAMGILDVLKSKGLKIEEDKALVGLTDLKFPGRMEEISIVPRIVVDGAHNAASIEALMKSLGQSISYDSMIVIFGCSSDKDVSGMLQQVQLGADKIIFTRVSNNPRACDPEQLARRYEELSGKMAQVAPDVSSALKIAVAACSREDLICITGSFYLVGEAKKLAMEGKLPVQRA